VQVHGTHVPPEHVLADGQAVFVKPRPSVLHIATVVVLAHDVEPGTHTRSMHIPMRQVWLDAQGIVVKPSPSSLQRAASVRLEQVIAPGTHLAVTQPPLEHTVPAAHADATHADPAMLHTSRCCTSVHRAAAGVQMAV
jgi:hypothetical protein